MGDRLRKNFEKRFGNRLKIKIKYSDKPLNLSEEKFQNEKIYEAVNKLLTAILGREPTPREILGIDDISKKIPKNRNNKVKDKK